MPIQWREAGMGHIFGADVENTGIYLLVNQRLDENTWRASIHADDRIMVRKTGIESEAAAKKIALQMAQEILNNALIELKGD